MKSKTSFLLASILVTPFSYAQTAVEDRVKALEERVGTLEALILKMQANQKSNPSQSDQPDDAVSEAIFYDGFEEGIFKWDEVVSFVPPERGTSSTYEVQSHDKFRAAKSLETPEGIVEPAQGKRFFTAANSRDGLAKIQSKASDTSGTVKIWRGIRSLVQKEGISLAGVSYPIVRFQARLPKTNPKKFEALPRGAFEVGYIEEKEKASHFRRLITSPKPTDGWEEFEVDLSSLPKDKKIRLIFRYIGTDARYEPNSGMLLDEITILDDK